MEKDDLIVGRVKMNEEQTKQIIHEIMWDYLDHCNSSEEEWNKIINEIYDRLKEKGVIK